MQALLQAKGPEGGRGQGGDDEGKQKWRVGDLLALENDSEEEAEEEEMGRSKRSSDPRALGIGFFFVLVWASLVFVFTRCISLVLSLS